MQALLTQGRFSVGCLAIAADQGMADGLPAVSREVNWMEEQQRDLILSQVYYLVMHGRKPIKEERTGCDSEVCRFLNEWFRFVIHQDVLYKKRGWREVPVVVISAGFSFCHMSLHDNTSYAELVLSLL